MKILILTVGRPKDESIVTLARGYLARVRPTGLVGVEHVPDASGRSPTDAMEREGREILRRVSSRDRAILLREDGRQWDSPAFASLLSVEMERTPGRVVLIIGGPWGTSDAVEARADVILSLSLMTFPHEMCFLFLAEQIYRATTILQGTGYHH